MPAASFLSKIPWKEILKAVAALGPLARQIYVSFRPDSKTSSGNAATSKKESVSLQEIQSRVTKLDAFASQQAQFNTQLTDQVTVLADTTNTISTRLIVLIWVVVLQMAFILILIARLVLKG